jgi:hypothetical protein
MFIGEVGRVPTAIAGAFTTIHVSGAINITCLLFLFLWPVRKITFVSIFPLRFLFPLYALDGLDDGVDDDATSAIV